MTVDEAIDRLPRLTVPRLPAPPAPTNAGGARIGLAVASMEHHTTDEGWQLFLGLRSAGYALAFGCDARVAVNARTVVVQDKREWDVRPGDFRDPSAQFKNVGALRGCGAFVVTVLKDAHQNPAYHRQSADEMGVHAWIVYYHPRIVAHLAPYARPEHLVRTHHTVDPAAVPTYSPDGRSREPLLSGALSGAYPLRQRLWDSGLFSNLRHPGYHRRGCATPEYLRLLSRRRVAVCTASIYGYALRKMIEATACGCAVVTDLPADDALPEIDANLHRVAPDSSPAEVADVCRRLADGYDSRQQLTFAVAAKEHYSYREVGRRLADDLEGARRAYGA